MGANSTPKAATGLKSLARYNPSPCLCPSHSLQMLFYMITTLLFWKCYLEFLQQHCPCSTKQWQTGLVHHVGPRCGPLCSDWQGHRPRTRCTVMGKAKNLGSKGVIERYSNRDGATAAIRNTQHKPIRKQPPVAPVLRVTSLNCSPNNIYSSTISNIKGCCTWHHLATHELLSHQPVHNVKLWTKARALELLWQGCNLRTGN